MSKLTRRIRANLTTDHRAALNASDADTFQQALARLEAREAREALPVVPTFPCEQTAYGTVTDRRAR